MLTDKEKDQLLTDAEIVMPLWIGDIEDDRIFNRKTEMAIHKLAYMEGYNDLRDFDICCPKVEKRPEWKISRKPYMAMVLATIGKPYAEIADIMCVAETTVKDDYIRFARIKLSCSNKEELAFKVHGLIVDRVNLIRFKYPQKRV